jgi:hypothetical protein
VVAQAPEAGEGDVGGAATQCRQCRGNGQSRRVRDRGSSAPRARKSLSISESRSSFSAFLRTRALMLSGSTEYRGGGRTRACRRLPADGSWPPSGRGKAKTIRQPENRVRRRSGMDLRMATVPVSGLKSCTSSRGAGATRPTPLARPAAGGIAGHQRDSPGPPLAALPAAM